MSFTSYIFPQCQVQNIVKVLVISQLSLSHFSLSHLSPISTYIKQPINFYFSPHIFVSNSDKLNMC